MAEHSDPHQIVQMNTFVVVLICLVAAALAPLVIPFTGGWLFFLLHEWFYPSEWGLPPLQSLFGVSVNCMAVGYVFTWFYGLPLALILRRLDRYRLRYLLVASALPALSLPFWQGGWRVSVLPVLIAGMSTAYVFWRLTSLGMTKLAGMGSGGGRRCSTPSVT
jgi:hypothetical protein